MGQITRAVIELTGDISPAMPLMKKHIESCGYNPQTPIAAFRYKDFGVIVERDIITVNNAEDEATAQAVIDFLVRTIGNCRKI